MFAILVLKRASLDPKMSRENRAFWSEMSTSFIKLKGTLSRGRMRQILETKLKKFSLNFSS